LQLAENLAYGNLTAIKLGCRINEEQGGKKKYWRKNTGDKAGKQLKKQTLIINIHLT